MARRRRPGRGCRRRRPARAGRGRLAGGLGGRPPVFRRPWRVACAPPGLRCRDSDEAMAAQLRRGPRPRRRRRTRAGQGRAPPPRRTPTRRSRRLGAVPGIGGRAPLRVRWPRGLGCGRPQARAKRGERGRGGCAASGRSRGVFRRLGGFRRVSRSALQERVRGALRAGFPAFPIASERRSESCPIRQSYRTSPHPRQAGRIARRISVTKRRRGLTMRQVIRADLDLLADLPPTPARAFPRRSRRRARAKRTPAKAPERQAFPPPAPVPAWARASGRAGEGDPLFAAGAGLALLDAFLRRDPPCRRRAPRPPGAEERRGLAPRSCASTPTKARCATCASPSATSSGPPANLLSLWRDLAGRPPSLDPRPDRRRGGAARPGSAGPERPRIQPEELAQGRAIRSPPPPRPPPWRSPPSRTPQPPKPKSSRSGCSTWSSPSGCAGRGPCR